MLRDAPEGKAPKNVTPVKNKPKIKNIDELSSSVSDVQCVPVRMC